MGIGDFLLYVMQRFTTTFTQQAPVRWPNSPFDQPKNGVWVEANILAGDPFSASIRGKTKTDRNVGILQFDVLSPMDSDAIDAYRAAEEIGAIFDSVTEAVTPQIDARFKVAGVKDMGTRDGYYRVMVRIPYQFDIKRFVEG